MAAELLLQQFNADDGNESAESNTSTSQNLEDL